MAGLLLIAVISIAQEEPPTPANREQAVEYYLSHRDKVARTAVAHLKVATWCQTHGLKTESEAQAVMAIKLDPRHESAWKFLGFKKHGGRWMTDAGIAEEDEQIKADANWRPILARLHDSLLGTDDAARGKAFDEITRIAEPRAVPAIWTTFVSGGAGDHAVAVSMLGKIRSKASSRVLAALAVFSASAEVRRRASETLRGRDPLDYAPPVVALLQKPHTYRTKTSGLDGRNPRGYLIYTVGDLSWEKSYRFYSGTGTRRVAMIPPNFGSLLTYAQNGDPALVRLSAIGQRPLVFLDNAGNLDPNALAALPGHADPLFAVHANGGPERQLEDDIAVLEAHNRVIRLDNATIMGCLKQMTGKDFADDFELWRAWLVEMQANLPAPGPIASITGPDNRFVVLVDRPSRPISHGKPGCSLPPSAPPGAIAPP